MFFPVNANDVLTLARAGFNAQQIAALATVNQQPEQPAPTTPAQPVPAPAPAQPAPPAAPAQPVPVPAPAQPANLTAPVQSENDVSAVLAKLGVLTEAIQSNGLLNANQPKQQTADEILAAIIQPPINKE